MRVLTAAAAALAASLTLAIPTRASAAVPCYIVGLVGTTALYRPAGGPVLGPQADVSASAGGGCFAFEKVAFEVDASVTRLSDASLLFSDVPGMVWAWHEHFYAAARTLVEVAPERALTLFPGLGAIYAFENGLSPLVEVNVPVGVHRAPDVGLAITGGVSFDL
jgi:hypothetical protein